MAVPLTNADLTTATIEGSGLFDLLMRAVKVHLDVEFKSGALRGSDYATVYLGSLDLAMKTGVAYLLARDKNALEADLMEQQVLLAQAQIEKVQAEIELVQKQIDRSDAEAALLAQKVITEQAQVSPTGVDPDSIIGKQKLLYQRQADGFKRDAEQKAAKILADSWSVRRTTDEGTVADSTNKLADSFVGQAMTALLAGVAA